MSNWGCEKPCASWWKSWTELVCQWPPPPPDNKTRPLFHSVSDCSTVILSFACLSLSVGQTPPTHTHTNKQAHTQEKNLTQHIYLSPLCPTTVFVLLWYKISYQWVCKLHNSQINTVLLETSSAELRHTPRHLLTQVYFGLLAMSACLCACQHGHGGKAAHSAQLPWHTFICTIRIKGSSSSSGKKIYNTVVCKCRLELPLFIVRVQPSIHHMDHNIPCVTIPQAWTWVQALQQAGNQSGH